MPPILRSKNRNLYIDLSPLLTDVLAETVLTADVAAAAGTITVRSTKGIFDQTSEYNSILLIGELGNEESEIILTHATTDPTATVITLASNTVRAHSAGTKVYAIKYNRIELSRAVTATGTKTTLGTTDDPDGITGGLLDIVPGEIIKVYAEAEFTTGFYFARFRNTVAAVFGDYSGAVPYGGYAENTVGHAIEWALRKNRLKNYTEEITPQSCLDDINDCLNEVQGKQVHWPEHQNLDYVMGQTTRGIFVYALPSDIYDSETNKSLIQTRIGDGRALTYKDPLEFEAMLEGMKYTKSTGSHAAAATTFNIDNSYDFDDDGSVNVYVSGTKYNITYTGVTRSATAGALTGVPASGTGSITVTIAAATYVYQDEEEGQPFYFTVRDGNLEIWPLPDGSWDNMNIYIDYWLVANSVDNEEDTLNVAQFDMVKWHLAWMIEGILKYDGQPKLDSTFYLKYRERLNDAIRTKRSGIKFKMVPKINRISYRRKKLLTTVSNS